MLPGAQYQDPKFSWKTSSARGNRLRRTSARIGLPWILRRAVGPRAGGRRAVRLPLTGNRRSLEFDDVLLRDRVADNLTFRELTESETLLIGRNFGVVTDIEPSPRGTLFVVSLDQGAIYEIVAPVERETMTLIALRRETPETLSLRPRGARAGTT